MQPYEKYLKQNSQKLRNNQTDAENKLWQRINRDQLLSFWFNRQKPLLSYIVDFYCAKAKLIIELDGSQHYEPDHQEKDALRDAELNSLGFTVMRFSNDEVMCEIEAVVEQIYLFLENVRADWVWGWINLCDKRLRLNVALATARSASEASKSPLTLFAKEGNWAHYFSL